MAGNSSNKHVLMSIKWYNITLSYPFISLTNNKYVLQVAWGAAPFTEQGEKLATTRRAHLKMSSTSVLQAAVL